MKTRLEWIVFICGACVMVLEMVGSRLMAPYLGTSLFVWTSLIGVILGCLSLGYWFGGLLADRKPEMKTLSGVIFFAGVSVSAVALAGDPVLYLIQSSLVDVRIGAVIATLILFGAPSTLLGIVSPYAVRLKLSRVESGGSAVGGLYALSTLGSIVGTFLAGFFLLSFFSHRVILFLISLTLIFLAMTVANSRWGRLSCLMAFILVSGSSFLPPFVQSVMGQGFVETQSAYNRIWVYNAFLEGRPIRVLQVNDANDSAMYTNSDELALVYTRYFRMAGHFHPQIDHALMIGGGAYSYPKYFLKEFPLATMDVVEIDPKLTQIAEQHFSLQTQDRLHIFHEDARTFLNTTKSRYNVIFGDVYMSYSVPFHLTTKEAIQKIQERLNDNGLFIMNVISSVEGDNGRFLRALIKTLDGSFKQVLVFAVDDPEDGARPQNLIVLAFKTKEKRKFFSDDPEMNHFLSHIWTRDILRDMPVLTDALAPVERYTARLVTQNPERRNGFMQKKLREVHP